MAEETEPAIVVENLRKSFGAQPVLNGIALTVREGETLAVLGRSGTGKSVLLKLIIGLQRADEGTVKVHGKEVTQLDADGLNEVRKRMGFLFQQAALYDSLTVEENVEFPLVRHTKLKPEERREKARDLLHGVGLEKDLNKLPSEISGGMQKRVGVARALALDPDILLFDEPTAGLDPITASELGQLIVDLKQKRKMSAVVVTHDLRGAKMFADRVALLHEGNIVAEGTFEELEENREPFVKEFLKDAL